MKNVSDLSTKKGSLVCPSKRATCPQIRPLIHPSKRATSLFLEKGSLICALKMGGWVAVSVKKAVNSHIKYVKRREKIREKKVRNTMS